MLSVGLSDFRGEAKAKQTTVECLGLLSPKPLIAVEGRLAPARPPPCTGGMQDCRTHASFTPSSGWIQQHCQHVSLYVEANVLELMGASAKCPYHLGVPCYKYIVENPKTLFQLSRSLYISKCEKTHQVFLHPTQQARSVYHTVCWKILKRTFSC